MKKLLNLLVAVGFLSGVTIMTAQASPDADSPDSGRDTAVTAIADHFPSSHAEHSIGEVEKESDRELKEEVEHEHESEVAGAHEVEHGEVSGAEARSVDTNLGLH